MNYRWLRHHVLVRTLRVLSVVGGSFIFVPGAYAATFYVSPNGSGTQCTSVAPCALTTGRDAARSVPRPLTENVTVILKGGRYELTSTFTLDSRDSGGNGFTVMYRRADNQTPVLSGGRVITGWTQQGSLWRASVGPLATRQLFVNGIRAQRARSNRNPVGFTQTTTGYTAPDASMASWGNITDIEIVSYNEWKPFRCRIASIVGTSITMEQPCWDYGKQGSVQMGPVSYIENAFEVLTEPGEWYLDRTAQFLYYYPRRWDRISNANVVAPTLETLVAVNGTAAAPVENLSLHGITFADATWLTPSSSEGYAPGQTGLRITGQTIIDSGKPLSEVAPIDYLEWYYKTPGAVTLSHAHSVSFQGDVFERIGSVALNFDRGSQSNTITGNIFRDIASHAIQLGDIHPEDHHPADARSTVSNNAITNNYIRSVGQDYADGVGIAAWFAQGTTIANNEIHDTPYSGITFGWGFGFIDPGGNPYFLDWSARYQRPTPTTLRDNTIRNNVVYDVVKTLNDGGCIYVQAAQPNSAIQGNVIHDHHGAYQGCVYLDDGSRYFTVADNGIYQNTKAAYVTGGDHILSGNYWQTGCNSPGWDFAFLYGGAITQINQTEISEASQIPASIVTAAGLQSSYAYLRAAGDSYDATYSFLDLTGNNVPVNGVHGGIDFGSGVWKRDDSFPGYALTNYGYPDGAGTTGSFTLPAGTVLRSVRLEGPTGGTYLISDGVNPNRTGSLAGLGSPFAVTTGWGIPSQNVTVTWTAGTAFTDLTYGPPLDVMYRIDDVACNNARVNGVHAGISFGNGVWKHDNSFPGYALTNYGYPDGAGTTGSFTLPAGTVLRSVQLEGPTGGTYLISDGVNPNRTGSLAGLGSPFAVTTGWGIPSQNVTVTWTAGTVFTDLTYGPP